jgi:hypothetical protein
MSIERGKPWGREVERPGNLVMATSDADAVRIASSGDERPIGLAGGDLHATLGAPKPRDPLLALEVDGICVELGDGEVHLAIAHVVARRSWWRGPVIAVMNIDRVGAWNAAPRAHPNDGIVDVVEVSASMPLRDRWAARSRLVTGTHVPHPAISTRRVEGQSWQFDDPLGIWIDGVDVGRAGRLSIAVEPNRFVVHV